MTQAPCGCNNSIHTDWHVDWQTVKRDRQLHTAESLNISHLMHYLYHRPVGSIFSLLWVNGEFSFGATSRSECVIGKAVDERQRWKLQPGGVDCEIHLSGMWGSQADAEVDRRHSWCVCVCVLMTRQGRTTREQQTQVLQDLHLVSWVCNRGSFLPFSCQVTIKMTLSLLF